MTNEYTEENKKLFSKYLNESNQRMRINQENYDKAILSLSSASLIFSLSFMSKLAIHNNTHFKWLIIVSWCFFVLSLIFSLVSLFCGQKANEKAIYFAKRYYIDGYKQYWNKKSYYDHLVQWLNFLSGFIYITALIFSVLYVSYIL